MAKIKGAGHRLGMTPLLIRLQQRRAGLRSGLMDFILAPCGRPRSFWGVGLRPAINLVETGATAAPARQAFPPNSRIAFDLCSFRLQFGENFTDTITITLPPKLAAATSKLPKESRFGLSIHFRFLSNSWIYKI